MIRSELYLKIKVPNINPEVPVKIIGRFGYA